MHIRNSSSHKPRTQAILWWALTLIWCGLIFGLTASHSFTAEATRRAVQEAAPTMSPTPATPALIDQANFLIRKGAHLFLYAILGALALMGFRTWPAAKHSTWAAWGFAILYASSDEIHQLFVPGRTGMVRDVLLDSLAAGTAVLLLAAILARRGRRLAPTGAQ